MTFESLPQIVSAAVVSIQQEVLSSRARLAEVLARLDTAERDHERWVLDQEGEIQGKSWNFIKSEIR